MLESLMRQIATAYDNHKHAPLAPAVENCYAALKSELWQQYQLLTAFVAVSFVSFDPYDNHQQMFYDLRKQQCLCVYASTAGLPANHPLSEVAPNGEAFNSIFRAVHDGLAHYPNRNDFTLQGEVKAYQSHARMLSADARLAVATETIGQQASMRYGKAKLTESFAEQKALLLPISLVNNVYQLQVP